MMFAKVGIIQQFAKHNLKKKIEARQYRLEIHVGIGISATKRKNEGVSLALQKQDSNPKNIYPLRLNDQRNRPLTTISIALAELQAKPSEPKPRKPIGFIQPNNDEDKK